MGWKELVSKLKLVDIDAKVETEQLGVANIKIENKTYNFHIPNPEAVNAFNQLEKTPELENEIHENAVRRLENVADTPELLSTETAFEVSAASASTAAMYIATKKLHPNGDIEK